MPQGHVVRDHYYTRVMADSNSDNKTTCLSFLSDMMIACSVLTPRLVGIGIIPDAPLTLSRIPVRPPLSSTTIGSGKWISSRRGFLDAC